MILLKKPLGLHLHLERLASDSCEHSSYQANFKVVPVSGKLSHTFPLALRYYKIILCCCVPHFPFSLPSLHNRLRGYG